MIKGISLSLQVNPRLQGLFEGDKRSDVRVVCICSKDGSKIQKNFNLHKEYLRLESEYFAERFRQNPSCNEIQIDVDDCDIAQVILRCFYGFTSLIEFQKILKGFTLCKFLKIETLTEQMTYGIMKYVEEFDILKLLAFSWREQNVELDDAILARLSQIGLDILQNGGAVAAAGIVPENFLALLETQGTSFRQISRIGVFQAIQSYFKAKYPKDPNKADRGICEMTCSLISVEGCTADEYQKIFHRDIFHGYNSDVRNQIRDNNVLERDEANYNRSFDENLNNSACADTPSSKFNGKITASTAISAPSISPVLKASSGSNSFHMGHFYTSNYLGGTIQSEFSKGGSQKYTSDQQLDQTFLELQKQFQQFSRESQESTETSLSSTKLLDQLQLRMVRLTEGQKIRVETIKQDKLAIQNHLAKTKKIVFDSIIQSGNDDGLLASESYNEVGLSDQNRKGHKLESTNVGLTATQEAQIGQLPPELFAIEGQEISFKALQQAFAQHAISSLISHNSTSSGSMINPLVNEIDNEDICYIKNSILNESTDKRVEQLPGFGESSLLKSDSFELPAEEFPSLNSAELLIQKYQYNGTTKRH